VPVGAVQQKTGGGYGKRANIENGYQDDGKYGFDADLFRVVIFRGRTDQCRLYHGLFRYCGNIDNAGGPGG
jgi:hypothetical protein